MSQTRLERVERSSSRFAGVTRVGLRVVVIAGFAGAAWALSATAANAAADPSAATATTNTQGAPLTSLVSLVNNVGTGTLHSLLGTETGTGTGTGTGTSTKASTGIKAETGNKAGVLAPVSDVLNAGSGLLSQVLAPTSTILSHQGTGTSRTAPRHAAVAQPVVSSRVTTQVPADTHTRPDGVELKDETGAGSDDLVRAVTNLVAPLGLDQVLQPTLDELQPMIGVVDPLTAPLDQLLDSVDGVTTPIFDAVGVVTAPVTGIVTRSTDGVAAADANLVVDQSAPEPPAPPAALVPTPEQMLLAATPVRVDDGTPAKRAIARHGTRGAPAHRSDRLGLDRHNIPASPVPLPALPAPALGAISTMGSGSHEGNGGFAVLSAPIVRDVAIQLRGVRAIGFAVRRLIVENPTVSPD